MLGSMDELVESIAAQIKTLDKNQLLELAQHFERRADSVPLYRDDGGTSLERRANLLDLADMVRREVAAR